MKNANPVSLRAAAVALVLLALLASGCGPGKPDEPAQKTIFDHFRVDVGGHAASLQVAVLDAEQERGLMQRPDLGRDEGMIFVCTQPRKQSFWMRNTPEPLDLAYLTSDGVVAETYELLPLDERPITSNGALLQFGLEMPKGWFAANGIHVGSRIDMKALAAALKERGFDPFKFGLE